MEIGVFASIGDPSGLRGIIDQVRAARDAGLHRAWLSQGFALDALAVLAAIGKDLPEIGLGTAVVPIYPRHPLVLAGQALTTQTVVGGRLALGIGTGHQVMIEGMMGLPFERPARHMREYLTVLRALVEKGSADFEGETLRTVTLLGPLVVPDASPFPVLVGAMGPAMVRVAGELSDGIITYMAGPNTVGRRIAPSIRAAAEATGRRSPRVVVGLPVCVTADPEAAKERAARELGIYGSLPSYRRVLDEEGVEGPAGVAVVGDEDSVAAQLSSLADRGATEFFGSLFGSGWERQATLRLLGAMARG